MAEEYAAVHQSTTLPKAGPTPGKNTLTGGSAKSLMMGVFVFLTNAPKGSIQD